MEAKEHILTDKESKIMISHDFKSFLKTKDFKNTNSRVKEFTVDYVTETYEISEIDNTKILAENEIFYLNETIPEVQKEYTEIESLENNQNMIKAVGNWTADLKMKAKLLERLENASNNFGQSKSAFTTQFEKGLKKNNSDYVKILYEKLEILKNSVGLEFPGSLAEMITNSEEIMVDILQKTEDKVEVTVPESCYRPFVLGDGFLMIVQGTRNEENILNYEPLFHIAKPKDQEPGFTLHLLKSENNIVSTNYINNVKYYPEANLLVTSSFNPREEKKCLIQIYQVEITEETIKLEPKNKIQTQSETIEFFRANGIEYIAFSDDEIKKTEDRNLSLANLEDTFNDPAISPRIEKIPMKMTAYRCFYTNNNMMVVEGPKDHLALVDVAQREVIGYYYDKETRKNDYFSYLAATYIKSKNLIFVLHNTQSGASISMLQPNIATQEIEHKEEFAIHEVLKAESLSTFASDYFTMQYNAKTNQINIVDGDFQTLISLKVDQGQKIQKNGTKPLKDKFKTRNSSAYGLFLEVEGMKYFLHYFIYENVLETFKIKA